MPHHLIVGACGAVGATYAYFLRDNPQKQIVSAFVRETRVEKFQKKQLVMEMYNLDLIYPIVLKEFIRLFLLAIVTSVWLSNFISSSLISLSVSCFCIICAIFVFPRVFGRLGFRRPAKELMKYIEFDGAISKASDILELTSKLGKVNYLYITLDALDLRAFESDLRALLIEITKSYSEKEQKLNLVNFSVGPDYLWLVDLISSLGLSSKVNLISMQIHVLAYQAPLKREAYRCFDYSCPPPNSSSSAEMKTALPSEKVAFFSISNLQVACSDPETACELCDCFFPLTVVNSPDVAAESSKKFATFLFGCIFVLFFELNDWRLSPFSRPDRVFLLAGCVLESLQVRKNFSEIKALPSGVRVRQKTFKSMSADHLQFLVKQVALAVVLFVVLSGLCVCQFSIFPFDIEAFLSWHFDKVGTQMFSGGAAIADLVAEHNKKENQGCVDSLLMNIRKKREQKKSA